MTSLTLIISALGTKNAGLHQSVVMLTGTMTLLFIKSWTTASAPSSYRSGTCLAPATFLGITLSFRLMRIGSPFIGRGLSSSLKMSSNSVVNSSDNSLTVVLKQNSSWSFSSIVFGNPCGIRLNSLRCFIPCSIAPLSYPASLLAYSLSVCIPVCIDTPSLSE